jgi:preprotein translocase subunit SecY
MYESAIKFFLKKKINQNNPTKKLLVTLFILFIIRFANTIPLSGIDQDALKRSFMQMDNKNAILQIVNMYSGGTTLLSPFSLGIIPYINGSILVDLLTAVFPNLEKLQQEEGEIGRQKLTFYKKILTIIFGLVQSCALLFYLKSYFYNTELSNFAVIALEFITGTLITVWLSTLIDNQGIGNGTSIIIFTNIVTGLINKNFFVAQQFNSLFWVQILFLLVILIFICVSQTARINIDVVSARQLIFLENSEKYINTKQNKSLLQLKDSGLSIRLNQAGIFPIIIASNLLPFFSFFTTGILKDYQILNTILYYLLIIGFNYFYTTVFWDPEKISEQLRKASVSIVNITPGKETISYLENVVHSTSLLGGMFLCFILFAYDSFKQGINGNLLNQINISSLIILVGVSYEIQKNIRALYRNMIDQSI